jgi:hypothetical protein
MGLAGDSDRSGSRGEEPVRHPPLSTGDALRREAATLAADPGDVHEARQVLADMEQLRNG